MKKVFAELGETAGKHVAETEAKARAMEAAEEEARKFALEEGGKAGINTYVYKNLVKSISPNFHKNFTKIVFFYFFRCCSGTQDEGR